MEFKSNGIRVEYPNGLVIYFEPTPVQERKIFRLIVEERNKSGRHLTL